MTTFEGGLVAFCWDSDHFILWMLERHETSVRQSNWSLVRSLLWLWKGRTCVFSLRAQYSIYFERNKSRLLNVLCRLTFWYTNSKAESALFLLRSRPLYRGMAGALCTESLMGLAIRMYWLGFKGRMDFLSEFFLFSPAKIRYCSFVTCVCGDKGCGFITYG